MLKAKKRAPSSRRKAKTLALKRAQKAAEESDSSEEEKILTAEENAKVVKKEGKLWIELREIFEDESDDDELWGESAVNSVEGSVAGEDVSFVAGDGATSVAAGTEGGSSLASLGGLEGLLNASSIEEGEEGGEEEGDENGEEDDEVSENSFGYKNVTRKEVHLPKNYVELQMRFIQAFPKHDASVACERWDGRTINPKDTDFKEGEVIVFREFQPSTIAEEKQKSVRGHGHRWEEKDYKPALDKFELRTWDIL